MRVVSFADRLRYEVRETLDRPSRIRAVARPAMVRDFVASVRDGRTAASTVEGPAATEREGGFIRSRYGSYEDYVNHQSAKLAVLDLGDYDVTYRGLLADRLRAVGRIPPGARVVCLAARVGTEVKAFHDLVLSGGPLPMAVLDDVVAEWTASISGART